MLAPLILAALVAGAPPRRPAAASPAELRDLTAEVEASSQEFRDAAERVAAARLRQLRDRQHALEEQLDSVEKLEQLAESDTGLVLMPHELARVRAERARLSAAAESAGDEVSALAARLGPGAVRASQAPWAPRRPLDPAELRTLARGRALSREGLDARLDAELARVGRAEHRLDDLEGAVLPAMREAADMAIIDLPGGGAMLDVLEALEQLSALHAEQSALQLDRELALARLGLLTGSKAVAPAPSGATARLGRHP